MCDAPESLAAASDAGKYLEIKRLGYQNGYLITIIKGSIGLHNLGISPNMTPGRDPQLPVRQMPAASRR